MTQPLGALRGRHLIDAVLGATAEYYGLEVDDLLGARQYRCVTRARHVAMYLIWTHSDWSKSLIGRVFNRDHTSIRDGCRHVAADEVLLGEATEILHQLPPHLSSSDPQASAPMIDLDSRRKGVG